MRWERWAEDRRESFKVWEGPGPLLLSLKSKEVLNLKTEKGAFILHPMDMVKNPMSPRKGSPLELPDESRGW